VKLLPSEIKGLKLVEISHEGFKYTFDKATNQETVISLIQEITENKTLSFFDGKHPKISDPGVYIIVTKKEGKMFAHCDNHGWSSKWVEVKEDDLINYIMLCIPYNDLESEEGIYLSESEEPLRHAKISKFRFSYFRRYLNKRLKKSLLKIIFEKI
jgi:hypothetical protein